MLSIHALVETRDFMLDLLWKLTLDLIKLGSDPGIIQITVRVKTSKSDQPFLFPAMINKPTAIKQK
jgi:hypothetical protein